LKFLLRGIQRAAGFFLKKQKGGPSFRAALYFEIQLV
jgi:hypothetical protein